ncbi:hypothetical protein EG856_00840 [Mycoplasmopsis phocirhinis]|uniref:Uncharacterized protein n=1 Tax=Mycoplasmopsis phocirhinis TaxID=142650 RepID=A0A4P6MP53_9BACT|nr:hypothetical protein [Mycoplasmopsis phocirhinis]QBF34476.1 hypothetical protein EG856_00840 [Mycoplasmopsis phocirhinis]
MRNENTLFSFKHIDNKCIDKDFKLARTAMVRMYGLIANDWVKYWKVKSLTKLEVEDWQEKLTL